MDDDQSQERVIKADKRTRRLFVAAWIVSVCLCAAMAKWMLPWGQGQLERAEQGQALRAIQLLIGFIFLSVIPFGVYLFRLGLRVVAHRQMPPRGTKVIVDTKVLEGDKAVTRGRLIMVMAVLLVALDLAGGLYLPYKIGKAFSDPIHRAPPQTSETQ